MLYDADIFIYQPFNKDHSYSEWDCKNVLKYLNNNCQIIRVNYYRFEGFRLDSEYKPFHNIGKYKFHPVHNSGIHDSFMSIDPNICDMDTVTKLVDNIKYDKDYIHEHFTKSVEKFKQIDDKSDVNMVDFFLKNYKDKLLFHDKFHPTLTFQYEIFRQLVDLIFNISIKDTDDDFLKLLTDIDYTHWAEPILPVIKNTLELNLPDEFYVFPFENRIKLNAYEYYYIRMSPKNFVNFMSKF